MEQNRGITIFSGLAHFLWNGHDYYLIDTPGHIDFAGETERAISVLDYAILVINTASGMEAHTLTLFELLKKHHIPVFFFLNKLSNIHLDSNENRSRRTILRFNRHFSFLLYPWQAI